ncbi:MAG: hypothetical protein KC475_03970 [Cyanobacteria bacterium HKST-UBA03]|nr:hypothetical protein [Cyanobacteria bacterium HKST-UBA03]
MHAHGPRFETPAAPLSAAHRVSFGAGWGDWFGRSTPNPNPASPPPPPVDEKDRVLNSVIEPTLTLYDFFEQMHSKTAAGYVSKIPHRLLMKIKLGATVLKGLWYLPWSSKKRILTYPFSRTFWAEDRKQGTGQVFRRLLSYAGPPVVKSFQRVANAMLQMEADADYAQRLMEQAAPAALPSGDGSTLGNIFGFTDGQFKKLKGLATAALVPLLDQVPPLPFPAVQKDIESILAEHNRQHPQTPLSLDQVNPTPIGSGSVAQIYEVREANGRKKAIKVFRPDVNTTYVNDYMKTIYFFVIMFLGRKHRDVARIVARQTATSLEQEVNAGFEQHGAAHIRHSLDELDNDGLFVPRIYTTTGRGMVMDYIDGTPLHRSSRAKQEQAVGDHAATLLRMTAVSVSKHNDLHPGNLLVDNTAPDTTRPVPVALIDFGRVIHLHPTTNRLLLNLYQTLSHLDKSTLEQFKARGSKSLATTINPFQHYKPLTATPQLLNDLDSVAEALKPLIGNLPDYGQTHLRQIAEAVIQAHLGLLSHTVVADYVKNALSGAYSSRVPGFGVLLDLYNSEAIMRENGLEQPVWLLYGNNLSQTDVGQAQSKLMNTLQLAPMPPYTQAVIDQTSANPKAVLENLPLPLVELALGKRTLQRLRQDPDELSLQFVEADPLRHGLIGQWIVKTEGRQLARLTPEQQADLVKHYQGNAKYTVEQLQRLGLNTDGQFTGPYLGLLMLGQINASLNHTANQLAADIALATTTDRNQPPPPEKDTNTLKEKLYADLLALMYSHSRLTRLLPDPVT